MDKRVFQVITHTTRESCRALARVRLGRHSPVVWFCVLVIAVGAVMLWLLLESYRATVLTTVLLVLLLYMLLRVRVYGAMLYQSRNDRVSEIALGFDEDFIDIHTNVEQSRIRYSEIAKLRRVDHFMMIYPRNHAAIVFADSEVASGSAEALSAFLCEKTGLEMPGIK